MTHMFAFSATARFVITPVVRSIVAVGADAKVFRTHAVCPPSGIGTGAVKAHPTWVHPATADAPACGPIEQVVPLQSDKANRLTLPPGRMACGNADVPPPMLKPLHASWRSTPPPASWTVPQVPPSSRPIKSMAVGKSVVVVVDDGAAVLLVVDDDVDGVVVLLVEVVAGTPEDERRRGWRRCGHVRPELPAEGQHDLGVTNVGRADAVTVAARGAGTDVGRQLHRVEARLQGAIASFCRQRFRSRVLEGGTADRTEAATDAVRVVHGTSRASKTTSGLRMKAGSRSSL